MLALEPFSEDQGRSAVQPRGVSASQLPCALRVYSPAYSHSNPSQKIKVGRRCNPEGFPPVSFLAPYGFTRPLTRTHVRLL
ncbi:hypothetical protein LINPERHAP2_LOCUS36667, partial [Linum perenne]